MVAMLVELLLTAAFSDYYQDGMLVKRGQVITGRKKLAKKLGLSEQEVRSCLDRLKSTNEITIKTTNKYSVITIVKYDEYQDKPEWTNQQINQENNQQTTNKQPTNNQQTTTIKEDKEYQESKEEKESLLDNNMPDWYQNEIEKQAQEEQEYKDIYECSLFELFEQEFARTISSAECQRLADWADHYDDKLIRYALRESLIHGVRSFDYIDRILIAWEKKGMTVEKYENGER